MPLVKSQPTIWRAQDSGACCPSAHSDVRTTELGMKALAQRGWHFILLEHEFETLVKRFCSTSSMEPDRSAEAIEYKRDLLLANSAHSAWSTTRPAACGGRGWARTSCRWIHHNAAAPSLQLQAPLRHRHGVFPIRRTSRRCSRRFRSRPHVWRYLSLREWLPTTRARQPQL